MADDPARPEETRTPLIGWLVRPAMSEDLVVELRAARPGEIADGALQRISLEGAIMAKGDDTRIVCGPLQSCETYDPPPNYPSPCTNLQSCNKYGLA